MKIIYLPILRSLGVFAWNQEHGLDTFDLSAPAENFSNKNDYWSNDCGPISNIAGLDNEDNYEVLYRKDVPAVDGGAYYPMVQAIITPISCEAKKITSAQENYKQKQFEKSERQSMKEERQRAKEEEKQRQREAKEQDKRDRQDIKEMEKYERQQYKEELQYQKQMDKEQKLWEKQQAKEERQREKEYRKQNKYKYKNKYGGNGGYGYGRKKRSAELNLLLSGIPSSFAVYYRDCPSCWTKLMNKSQYPYATYVCKNGNWVNQYHAMDDNLKMNIDHSAENLFAPHPYSVADCSY